MYAMRKMLHTQRVIAIASWVLLGPSSSFPHLLRSEWWRRKKRKTVVAVAPQERDMHGQHHLLCTATESHTVPRTPQNEHMGCIADMWDQHPPSKIYLRKTCSEELFSGRLRQFCVINHAKELSEKYFLGSYVNLT